MKLATALVLLAGSLTAVTADHYVGAWPRGRAGPGELSRVPLSARLPPRAARAAHRGPHRFVSFPHSHCRRFQGVRRALARSRALNPRDTLALSRPSYDNYRHQADACHAYQVFTKAGIPASNIITMMQDDVASSSQNPFPGQLFNRPADGAGNDVYKGCNIDYRG